MQESKSFVSIFISAATSLALVLLISQSAAYAENVVTYGSEDAHACFTGANTAHLSAASALPACDKALAFQRMTRREEASTFVNRAILQTHLRNFDAAFKDLNRALELMPNFAEARLNRGNVFLFVGSLEQAVKEYDAAIEYGTRKPHAAFYNRGLAYEALGRPKLAYQDFVRAAELRPSWGLATSRIARYAQLGYGE
jgi:tetratricopeptide (TPR) repeat protein